MSKEFAQGWSTGAGMAGAMVRNQADLAYVQNVQAKIDELYNNLMNLKSNQGDAQLGGFMAEDWHAGTFNIKAAVNESKSVAVAGKPNSTGDMARWKLGSVDVRVTTAKGENIDYGSKYMVNAKETAKEQARPSTEHSGSKYGPQKRLVASDQLEDVKGISESRASNEKTPDNWKQGYQETADSATDTVSDGKIESERLSKDESKELAREVKEDKLDLEKRGITTEQQIEMKNILGRSFKAGMLGSAISAALATAPDIVGMIAKLIKSGEMDVNDLKNVGSKGAKAGADGFVKGSLASFFTQLCISGKLGPDLKKSANPSIVSSLVVITIETVKNSILLAQGKITAREMGDKLIDTSITTFAFLGAIKLGGMIGQSIAPQLPVVGFLVGSLIGCGCCAVYQIGKKCLISFCKDSGFTCFGLVEQDYSLPDEALKNMGVDLAKIQMANVQRANIQYANIQGANTNSIQLKMIRRGVFSLNKIGYVYQ